MINEMDEILYIGKSVNLRSRVRSYFRENSSNLSPRIDLMIRQVYDIECIITDNESEALTLEENLIKKNQPYYNVLLKDDKKYPFICISWSEKYPRVYITRKRNLSNRKDKYYGPYVDVTLLRKTLSLVKSVFPLRQRSIPLYKDRTCLNYSIDRCPGVCQEKISSDEYKVIIKKVEMIFQGRSLELIKLLKDKMSMYSHQLNFERAAIIRDQINSLKGLGQDQKITLSDSSLSIDIIAIEKDTKIACIQIFQMRQGKIIAKLGYTSSETHLTPNVILQRIIEEHYSNAATLEIPMQILVSCDLPNQTLIGKWLSDLRKKKVTVKAPLRNTKAQLIHLVQKNAEYELKRIQSNVNKVQNDLEDLAQILQLDNIPNRIECIDISHIQGSDPVGSQIVFIKGIPAKQHYRRYKIKSKSVYAGHSDDYLAMAEVVRRRFRKWSQIKNQYGNITQHKDLNSSLLQPSSLTDWPDLFVIDGGKGQLSTVMEVLRHLNLENDLNICALAKKQESVYLPNQSTPLDTDKDQSGILLLRRARDEAHRFALTFHRNLRNKRMTHSNINDIKGIGSTRRRLLLEHFKSVEAIKLSTLDKLKDVPGLGDKCAIEIWNYFHT